MPLQVSGLELGGEGTALLRRLDARRNVGRAEAFEVALANPP
jgi:hypothetical protein